MTPRDTDEGAKRAIGLRIHQARQAAGFANQDEFAKAAGVPRRTVSRWETGVHLPDEENRQDLSKLLNVPEDDLRLPTPQETHDRLARLEEGLEAVLAAVEALRNELTAPLRAERADKPRGRRAG